MSYSLPKYYFQDIHPDVMEEIMRGMEAALPEPSWEEIDNWLNTHNVASTIPGWYDRAGEFTSTAWDFRRKAGRQPQIYLLR